MGGTCECVHVARASSVSPCRKAQEASAREAAAAAEAQADAARRQQEADAEEAAAAQARCAGPSAARTGLHELQGWDFFRELHVHHAAAAADKLSLPLRASNRDAF